MKIRIGFVSNSSSEAFICETDREPEQIETELRWLLMLYNVMTGHEYAFHAVFDTPIKIDKNTNTDTLRNYLGYYRTSKLQENDDLVGKVIIYSHSDNTIPYALFEIIEEAYDATRVHMG